MLGMSKVASIDTVWLMMVERLGNDTQKERCVHDRRAKARHRSIDTPGQLLSVICTQNTIVGFISRTSQM